MSTDDISADFEFGKWLSNPHPGEEVVISGISGRFPKCNNVQELCDNLFNKEDMIEENDERWSLIHPEIPKRSGIIPEIDKFDAGFFGLHHRQIKTMDPALRKLLEVSVEAVVDAGLHPLELKGSKTGVFVGYSWADQAAGCLDKITEPQQFAITGYLKSMAADRVSYFFKLKGPSVVLDSACSSSLNALDHAFRAIRTGKCEQAFIAGLNLTLHPAITLQFFRMGLLSTDGACKVFDKDAVGYVRGEAISCIFLQRAETSKRIYAQVIYSKSNTDGFKEEGLHFPSFKFQAELLKEVYRECGITANQLSYLELHGTGTKVGDLQEIQAVDEVIGKHRDKPLWIGSVKSNLGHSEPASGMSSIIKVILAMETGYIPPNLHFKEPKQGMDALFEGRLIPVTEKVPLDEETVIGISNFGFGGSNCHVVLRQIAKNKVKKHDDIPKLICVSGRTREAVEEILKEIIKRRDDAELIALVQNIFRIEFSNHMFRGFVVLTTDKPPAISIRPYKKESHLPPFYLYFGNFEKSYMSVAKYLLKFPMIKKNLFEQVNIDRCNLNFDQIIINCVKSRKTKSDDYIFAAANVQMCILSILKTLELIPLEIKKYPANEDSIVLDLSNSYIQDVEHFLETIGRLFVQGYNPQIQKLYEEIKYPASRGTPSISSLVKWNHDKTWPLEKIHCLKGIIKEKFKINLNEEDCKYIRGHVIDGRNLFPATGYLYVVWQIFAGSKLLQPENCPVVFENCKFVRATTVKNEVVFSVFIQEGSGNFEILTDDVIVVKGRITYPKNIKEHHLDSLEPKFEMKNSNLVLEKEEIYKELNLRGYNYTGIFKGLSKSNVDATRGLVKWNNNWVSFMDNMLQIKILQMDTRNLYVPTLIKKLVIDPFKQRENVEIYLPVVASKEFNIIKSGGVEIHGLKARAISRKLPMQPVLEKYVFIPDNIDIDLKRSVRINIQLVLENSLVNDVKAVEIVDELSKTENALIMPLVYNALENIPVVRPDLTVSTQYALDEIEGVKIEKVELSQTNNLLLIVATKILQRSDLLRQVLLCLGDDGFALSREKKHFEPDSISGITVLTQHVVENEKLILFKKSKITANVCIEISSDSFTWISKVQHAFSNNGSDIILYSQDHEINGILGFINCIRQEPGGKRIKCFLIMGEAPKFDPLNPLYKTQLEKNLAINIYKNSEWGTYRHLLLEELTSSRKKHAFISVTSRGNLSSLRWVEGPLQKNQKLKNTIYIYYSAINFKDIMTATGRVTVTGDRMIQDSVEGFEYSGRDSKGNPVMGMVNSGALSNLIKADVNLCWSVPTKWNLEDAATVPVVYSTVIYALLMRTTLKPGTSILIHSATGGIGIAALNIVLHYGCNVFVTVGTQEKINYLKTNFQQIPESHIGNSRDTSFVELIKKETNGRGVDIVLNSLAEEKLIASIHCLAHGGQFMEIGKFDLENDNELSLFLLEREGSYHGIMLDTLFNETVDIKRQLTINVSKGIKEGYVKPLPRTVFNHDDVETAFKYMTTGKHIGKVLVKIREHDDKEKVSAISIPKCIEAVPRFYCDTEKSYVILGGLGGFGLELADWLVLRGAKKLILLSRIGIQNGYQNQRIGLWQSYGVLIRVSTANISTREGCLALIEEANQVAPVDGVFNLAAVLEDALFEDQTEEKFKASLAPKAYATKYLDEITRELCPNLRYFVVFSSVSCGRGNAGQTNYGMANSIMERICEKRKQDGYPALAIQWGAVGDVGLVAKMQKDNKELVIGGTLQQKISSCLSVMDRFLNQNDTIVASMVVAQKRDKNSEATPIEAVAKLIGIKDLKTVSHQFSLAELGMDSMMGTEVIQILEKDFGIYVTTKEVRTLTLAKLKELECGTKTEIDTSEKNKKNTEATIMLTQHMPSGLIVAEPFIQLKEHNLKTFAEIFIFPGIEGIFKQFDTVLKNLKANVFGVQYNYQNDENEIEKIAEKILPHIQERLSRNKSFFFIAHSFGVLVALELASLLEIRNYSGKIAALDGSPLYSTEILKRQAPSKSESEFETLIIFNILSLLVPIELLKEKKNQLINCKNFNERLDLAISLMNPEILKKHEVDKQGCVFLFQRFKSIRKYDYTKMKLKSLIKLYKCEFSLIGDMPEDYDLSKYCENAVESVIIEGNHVTMLQQHKLVEDLNKFFYLNP